MERVKLRELRELNLLDKFLFDEAMEDRETYQMAVSILMENEVEFLEKPETEKELRVSSEIRQVRLDVVGMDKKGKIYYAEMQKRNTGNLIRRSRYYQAQLDVSLLEPGSMDFNLLNDSLFIMIAPFDIFGRGLYRYTFEEVCRECPDLKLDDGAVRIFINTKGNNQEDFSQEFLNFMKYLENTTDENAEKSGSERIKKIHEKVCRIRESEKAGIKYMQRWEEIAYAREEGRIYGKTEGELLKLINLICKKIKKGQSPEEIAEVLEEEIETVLPIYNLAVGFAPEYDCEKIFKKYYSCDS